jgi:hypothetical protein
MTGRVRYLRALACSVVVLSGCASSPVDDQELAVVRRAAPPRDPSELTRVHRLVAKCAVEAAGGAYELWVPLPSTDRWQVVRSIAFEVPPDLRYVLEEDAEGVRVLHVTGPAPGPVTIRAEIERPAPPTELPALPAALDGLAADLDPVAWTAAATERGAKARVALGVELPLAGTPSEPTPERRPERRTLAGEPARRRWSEVLLDGAWTPVTEGRVGLPQSWVRLATVAARATLAGRATEPTLEWKSQAP